MKMLTRLGYPVEEQGVGYIADIDAHNPLASAGRRVRLSHRAGAGMTAETLATAFDSFFTTRLGRGGPGPGLTLRSSVPLPIVRRPEQLADPRFTGELTRLATHYLRRLGTH